MLGQSFVVVSISLAVGLVALFGPARISAGAGQSQEEEDLPRREEKRAAWNWIEKNKEIFGEFGYEKKLFDVYESRLIDLLRKLRSPISRVTNPVSPYVVNHLTMFEKIKKMIDEKDCDQDSVDFRNALAETLSPISSDYLNLRAFVQEWSTRHFEICLKVHEEEYFRRAEIWTNDLDHMRMEQRIRPFITELSFQLFKAESEKNADEERPCFDRELMKSREPSQFHVYLVMTITEPIRFSEGNLPAEIAYDTVNMLAKTIHPDYLLEVGHIQRIDGEIAANPDQAKELFTELILRSCIDYVGFWGPNLFSVIKKDRKWIKKPVLCEHIRKSQPFYQTWLLYNSCEALMDDTSDYVLLIEKIGQVAERHSKSKSTATATATATAETSKTT